MKILVAFYLSLLLFFAPSVHAADDLTVEATVDRREVPLNQMLVFVITITGGGRGIPEPELPQIDGFIKVGQSSASSISIINMDMTTSKEISYTLKPQKKGSFTLPPVSLSYKGKVYTTKPVDVRVGDPVQQRRQRRSRQPRSFGGFFDDPFSFRDKRRVTKDDVFATMEADNEVVYVNEQVILNFSLYNDRTLHFFQDPAYTPPSFKGAWAEEIPVENSGRYEFLNNRQYMVSRMRHAVFPVSKGVLRIGEASVTVQFDPFSSALRIQSNPVEIKVKPLPPRPDGIEETSLVGSFGIHAEFDRGETKAGEPVEVVVTIKGAGSIHSIKEPSRPLLDSFEVYGPEEEESMRKERGFVEGEKRFKYILIPRKEGTFDIGPFTSAYFDPEKEKYMKLQTGRFTVRVLPGKGTASPMVAGAAKSDVALLGQDIHFIKGDKERLSGNEGPLYQKIVYKLLIIIPAVAFLLTLFYLRRRKRLEANPAVLKRAKAFSLAKKRIEGLGRGISGSDPKRFYAELENTLRQYIGDKLNVPAPSADPEMVTQHLNGKDGDTLENLRRIFEICALARFSASNSAVSEREESLKKTLELVTKLEKSM
ncbi:MAG: BatD family protein [Nitrospinota bacterium]